MFVGTWAAQGQQFKGPIRPPASISAVETYEWLTGEAFLVHRFEGRVGVAEAECIEIIGHGTQNQSYCMHTFYNNGFTNEWQLSGSDGDGTWTRTGDW